MSADKTTENAKTAAEQAEEMEIQAKTEPNDGSYTHTFKRPYTYQGTTLEELTFDWDSLTGNDYIAIENELLRRGKTLVTPEFTIEFLCGMAVRACTRRSEEGFRVLSVDMMGSMPMREFRTICNRARSFLLRAGL